MEPRLFDLDFQLLADSTLMLIAVFVLFIALSHFLFNPARQMLQKRRDKIQEELTNAASDQQEASDLRTEYEAKLKDIDKEAQEILSAARKKALANENRIVADAKEDARKIIDRAGIEAELEKKKAADEVKQEMISIASLMAGKVVTASIDTQVQAGLIDETLKEIGDSTWLS
ncbi:MAG: F0F1 ATP synthase subunit B [Lachnospiraceae bacterium]